MQTLPLSAAENYATKALTLSSFAKFSLVGAREKVSELLRTIGQNGIFNEYTRHDITHIDTLLGMLDWIVIPEAQKQMTPADWLLVVLAIYFHDAGMVVTRKEYEQRESSPLFVSFRKEILDATEPSAYKERISLLGNDEREKFIYQEFVRTYHAKRIKAWINGDPSDKYGVSQEAREVVEEIVSNLDETFREDLALVCESHHENDLQDLAKYHPQKAYGSDLAETANLQFASILLRTVDLLHVTQDRAPSIAFKLSTPSDPKSIEEWHKQMPVVAVRESRPRDDQGNVKTAETPYTVAVTANFRDPNGFFSLTEYLFYAENQLKQSHQWAEQTRVRENFRYIFPWRKVDSEQVKATNFESKQFAFELDKPKILKLLTGHTLYSNPDVVIRELIQNSLDAVRLEFAESKHLGEIALSFDSKTRLLTVDDNGTGMTQQIIENHFLNVGSSRYGDESFRKQYPNFSAISRFGIGILSTFMMSDEIEVITKSSQEEKARNISIRSINGRYLIRLLDPNSEIIPPLIREHGTRIQLKLRAGVKEPNLVQTSSFWILFPECKVTVRIDDGTFVEIGNSSPKAALEKALRQAGLNITTDEPVEYKSCYKVIEKQKDGLKLAYALEWSPTFKVWNLAPAERLNIVARHPLEVDFPVAMCVQGVRVENTSPGFAGRSILAISNITGSKSPATNVARSSFEFSGLVDEMLGLIYGFFAEHITSEIVTMEKSRGVSVSAAASEGRFLLTSLTATTPSNLSKNANELFRNSLRSIPWLTLDKNEERVLVTLSDLEKLKGFWTVESSAYKSAEDFIRRMPSGVSFRKLASIGGSNIQIPGDILTGYAESYRVRDLLFESFDSDEIQIQQSLRQVNFHWRSKSTDTLWKSLMPTDGVEKARVAQFIQLLGQLGRGLRVNSIVYQVSNEIRLIGVEEEAGVRGAAKTYVFKGNDLHALIERSLAEVESGREDVSNYLFMVGAINLFLDDTRSLSESARYKSLEHFRQQVSQQAGVEVTISEELRMVLSDNRIRIFNPFRGERFGMGYGFDFSGNVD